AYAFIHTDDIKARLAELFGGDMQFDVIIGNPPYQMTGGAGGSSDSSIYHLFVEQAQRLDPRYLSMVVPSRWLAGGRGLDNFRASMLGGGHLRNLVDFPASKETFPGVEIKGGICYFLWSKDYSGKCDVMITRDGVSATSTRDLGEFDVFVRDPQSVAILHKVLTKGEPSITSILSRDTPFGIPSNYEEFHERARAGDVPLYLIQRMKRRIGYIPRNEVSKNADLISTYKVLLPKAFNGGDAMPHQIVGNPEYGIGLSPNEPNPENAVRDLVSFLPVLAYDGANMTQIDAGGILDIAMAGTSATLLARKWESALLVNVDNDTLRRIMDNPEAMAAVERIEGWRSLGDNIIGTIINKSEKVKELKNKARDGNLTTKEKKELTAEEKEYKSKRKLVQEKLIKFATRIPAFMYLTDFRENTLRDVITKLEPDLFLAVTGLAVKDFHLLVRLKVFNTEQMNQAVFAFRRYEDASLRYTGIESHKGLTHYGLYDTVVARD
ncbi:MAG: Eco57I restriction-modification methylase domain-containing protein, partial [Thiobacillaceae bacterium]